MDDLNGLSFNKALTISSTESFAVLFGVDRDSVGQVPPDPAFIAANRPFNVMDQAMRNQEAGDLYAALDTFDMYGLAGGISPDDAIANNTLAINQGDTGGVDQDLGPELAPAVIDTMGIPDNANAASYPPPYELNPSVFYTLNLLSPSMYGPGYVYVDTNTSVPYCQYVFAEPSDLGLIESYSGPKDDIDALVVFDFDGDNELDVGTDLILFSLTRTSPTLATLGASAADILISRGDGVCTVYAAASLLGLSATTDDLDCIEVRPFTATATASKSKTAMDEIMNWAVYRVWPGDADTNGTLDMEDCSAFRGCYTGDGKKAGKECLPYDIDFDGDVDCADLRYFRTVYDEATYGKTCYVITADEFVEALLSDKPMTLEFACYADLNGDEKVDNRDVALFAELQSKPLD